MESTPDDEIEVLYTGACYRRNGKHYIKYEGPVAGTEEIVEHMMKISQNEVDISTKSTLAGHMFFTMGRKNRIFYNTPYGAINIGIDTFDLNVAEENDRIFVEIRYDMDINQDMAYECKLTIEITALEDNK